MDIEQCKETYEMLKKHKELVANIDKDFFLNFAELLFNELEISKKETQEVLNDYQDLGKEKYKLECELEKKDKVINEMAKFMAGRNSFMHGTVEQIKEHFTEEVEGE